MENSNDKIYCRYAVIDLYTGYLLIAGEKWKDIYFLRMFHEYKSTFRSGWRFRKIEQYQREIIIKGRPCLLVMWANAPQREIGSTVQSVGCCVGLQGKYYDNSGTAMRFDLFLRCHGYTRERTKK